MSMLAPYHSLSSRPRVDPYDKVMLLQQVVPLRSAVSWSVKAKTTLWRVLSLEKVRRGELMVFFLVW